LPITETSEGDVSAYIPTNAIPITDGQVFPEKTPSNRGTPPAINVGPSVSRVGPHAQAPPARQIAGRIKPDPAQPRDVESSPAPASEPDAATRSIPTRGLRLVELLRQQKHMPLAIEIQPVTSFSTSNRYFEDIAVENTGLVEGRSPTLLLHSAGALLSDDSDTYTETDIRSVCELSKLIGNKKIQMIVSFLSAQQLSALREYHIYRWNGAKN